MKQQLKSKSANSHNTLNMELLAHMALLVIQGGQWGQWGHNAILGKLALLVLVIQQKIDKIGRYCKDVSIRRNTSQSDPGLFPFQYFNYQQNPCNRNSHSGTSLTGIMLSGISNVFSNTMALFWAKNQVFSEVKL